MTVIATAGHVDHGKSTLVKVLTGTDPDRWAEEKSRGLTIDLGFANATLPSGAEFSFIDVPGHIRFLRNMLSGVGAVDGCLFVVAATEGWKPQSEEHLRILSLLGLQRGIVALTKVDQVDDDLFELAKMDVEEHVTGTFLESAPIVGVSALENLGMDDLRSAIDNLISDIPARDHGGNFRLWVDRSFAPAGAGTVVTGTLTGGALSEGEEVSIVPGSTKARIRSLQSHHRSVATVEPGNRVAVNLTGVNHTDIKRGHVLIDANRWHHSAMVDAELAVLESLGHPVTRRGAYSAYIGSCELAVKVRVLTQDSIQPGATGSIRLYLDRNIPVIPGDRFILRESGRNETVGGGLLLDVSPVLTAATATPDLSIERVVAERGWVEAEELERLTGQRIEPTVGKWVADPEALEQRAQALLESISTAGPLGLDIAGLDDYDRAVLESLDDVSVDAGKVTIGEPVDPLADHPWVQALTAEPFTPPSPEGIDRAEIRELIRRGTVVEQEGVYFSRDAIDLAVGKLGAILAAQPSGITVAEARDALGTTRKYVLPILAYMDGNGITRRREDLRIAGPRMPAQ